MTIAEKISKASPLKDEGNIFFKAGQWADAKKAYTQAADYISKTFGASDEESRIIKDLNISLFSNLAAVCLKLNDAKLAVEHASKVLSFDPKHAKANYRLSQAKLALGLFEEAVKVLEDARDLLDMDVNVEIMKIKKVKQVQNEKEKKMYSKMFA